MTEDSVSTNGHSVSLNPKPGDSRHGLRLRLLLPALIAVAGLSSLYPMQRLFDRSYPHEVIDDETLYLTGKSVKRWSLGLDSIVSDIYWIRTLQYFGRKLLAEKGLATDTRQMRLDLLAPLLDAAVTLDPQNIPAYRFGAVFLPERDPDKAVELLNRGIEANPNAWRLYQDLGYVYWQLGKYDKAAEVYERGGKIPGVPSWMADLAGVMRIKGGSREVARALYTGYLDSEDKNIREKAISRLKELDALDQIDALNYLLQAYSRKYGSCPDSMGRIAREAASIGFKLDNNYCPLDPDGLAYALNRQECRAELDPNSKIPRLR